MDVARHIVCRGVCIYKFFVFCILYFVLRSAVLKRVFATRRNILFARHSVAANERREGEGEGEGEGDSEYLNIRVSAMYYVVLVLVAGSYKEVLGE